VTGVQTCALPIFDLRSGLRPAVLTVAQLASVHLTAHAQFVAKCPVHTCNRIRRALQLPEIDDERGLRRRGVHVLAPRPSCPGEQPLDRPRRGDKAPFGPKIVVVGHPGSVPQSRFLQEHSMRYSRV